MFKERFCHTKKMNIGRENQTILLFYLNQRSYPMIRACPSIRLSVHLIRCTVFKWYVSLFLFLIYPPFLFKCLFILFFLKEFANILDVNILTFIFRYFFISISLFRERQQLKNIYHLLLLVITLNCLIAFSTKMKTSTKVNI